MAIAADVPIIPHIVWGAQRIWTKDHPKKLLRPKVPIAVTVGEPIEPTLPAPELTALLHYPHAALAGSRSRKATGRIRPVSSGCRAGSAGVLRRWAMLHVWTPKRLPAGSRREERPAVGAAGAE